MTPFQAAFDVFSPRWGHPDKYTVTFTESEARIVQGTHEAVCKFAGDADPEWVGHRANSENPLIAIFENDGIYPPTLVPSAIEGAWKKWHERKATGEEVKVGLDELFKWIDMTARNKPKDDLWSGLF